MNSYKEKPIVCQEEIKEVASLLKGSIKKLVDNNQLPIANHLISLARRIESFILPDTVESLVRQSVWEEDDEPRGRRIAEVLNPDTQDILSGYMNALKGVIGDKLSNLYDALKTLSECNMLTDEEKESHKKRILGVIDNQFNILNPLDGIKEKIEGGQNEVH